DHIPLPPHLCDDPYSHDENSPCDLYVPYFHDKNDPCDLYGPSSHHEHDLSFHKSDLFSHDVLFWEEA
ncbi:hypothetical protein R0K05_24930, partial [Planococcus sp. SIMBA_160]